MLHKFICHNSIKMLIMKMIKNKYNYICSKAYIYIYIKIVKNDVYFLFVRSYLITILFSS